jgi:hypothetical protein
MAVAINDQYAGQADTEAMTADTQFFSTTFEVRVDVPGPHKIGVTPVGNTSTSAEDIFNVSYIVK